MWEGGGILSSLEGEIFFWRGKTFAGEGKFHGVPPLYETLSGEIVLIEEGRWEGRIFHLEGEVPVPPPPLKMSKGKLHSNLRHANQELCILFPEQEAVFLSE